MRNIDNVLASLNKSTFRTSFKLKQKDIEYINKVGIAKIKEHAHDLLLNRVAPCNNPKDGKQTPTHGHPVFIAQHATATCCRGCIEKWYHFDKNHDLTENELEYLVSVIMKWIEGKYK